MERLAETKTKSPLRELSKKEGGLTSRDIFDAAAGGDALADKIVDETAFYLAIGSANVMHTIDPDMIVFGGGMVAAGESFLGRIKEHIKKVALAVPAEKTIIAFASLGNDAGYIGAAACGRQLYWKRKKTKV
jgi:glucokinase